MHTLLELAERCERATGPDSNLDCAIFASVQPEAFDDAEDAALYSRPDWTRNRADWRFLSEIGMRRYTSSLDAALTLVPEDAFWRLGHDGEGQDPGAFKVEMVPFSILARSRKIEAVADTPALALCAAALKARAAAQEVSA